MASDYRNRGLFGYEGEGFMQGGGRDIERSGFRGGWNVGSDDDREREARDWHRESYRGRGPKSYRRSDERIREDICDRLTWDEYVDASDIEVQVSDGTVTLSGQINDRNAKRRAEDIAESVTGVRDIENQIRVTRGNNSY